MTTFTGIIPAAIVPFTADDAVDLDAYQANVAHVIEHGAAGVVANGTMGEAGQLTTQERDAVLRAAIEVAAGRVPVVAGVMCLPPLNYRGTAQEVEAFFTAVAAVGLPVMLYNNPEASGTDLPAEQIAAIAAAVPGIVAVKECSGDARRIAALCDATGLDVLVGGDDWALEGFAAGAVGWVSGVANVAPGECVALLEAVAAGRLADARALNTRLLPLGRLDMTPWLVQCFKAAMDEVGLAGGPVRAPRLALSPAGLEAVRAAVSALREPVAA